MVLWIREAYARSPYRGGEAQIEDKWCISFLFLLADVGDADAENRVVI